MAWNGAQLTETHEKQIRGWPLTNTLHITGIGDVLFCHATPRNDTEIFTAATSNEKLRPLFDPLNVAVAVCGHVHMQFDRVIGTTRVVNAGSVGMPFDDPGAYWLVLDSGVELRRTSYDFAAGAERVRNTAYPQAEAFANGSMLNPPSRERMMEAFSRAELS
jgi:Icc-related predicted phosphoesterase